MKGEGKGEGINTSWDENMKKRQVSFFFLIEKKGRVVGTGRKMCGGGAAGRCCAGSFTKALLFLIISSQAMLWP